MILSSLCVKNAKNVKRNVDVAKLIWNAHYCASVRESAAFDSLFLFILMTEIILQYSSKIHSFYHFD